MSFESFKLSSPILRAVRDCGYTQPTPIQESCIPPILKGKDLVASAQTGSGKTAAFVLPALQHLETAERCKKPRILILTPTRELAGQITKAVNQFGKFLRMTSTSVVGGVSYFQQSKSLLRPLDIIVATPGRLLDFMLKQKLRLNLSSIEMLILDEADRMLDMGFIDDVKRIAKAISEKRQTLLFGATINDNLAPIIKQLMKDPIRIDLSPEKMTPTEIKQELYFTDNIQHKARLLEHFLSNERVYKAIIFSGTKINADKVAKQLRDKGHSAGALHGDLRQNVRTRTVEWLRTGKIQYLVATDVAARGIDISDVTHVINYDLPKFSEDYVHRIGRTGRAGRLGVAISMVLPTDKLHLQRIERYLGQRLSFSTVAGLEPTTRFTEKEPSRKKGPKKAFRHAHSRRSHFGGHYI